MCMVNLKYPSQFLNQIVIMAAAPPKNLVTTVCENVFSLTASQRDATVNSGWAPLADFQGFNYD